MDDLEDLLEMSLPSFPCFAGSDARNDKLGARCNPGMGYGEGSLGGGSAHGRFATSDSDTQSSSST